ncbi:MAG: hypothetical protein ABI891_12720 [Acidobacteriota bacterium]
MKSIKFTVFCSFLLLVLASSFSAQTKKRNPERPTPTPTATVQPKPEETEEFSEPKSAGKKNVRPTEENVKSSSDATEQNANSAKYTYDFSQPNFLYSHIFIEHDENGKGKIMFSKQNFSEEITDPIQLSPATLEKLANIRQALNFLDSKENYQYEKDYSHLGNMTFTMKKDGRERKAKFNWTGNADAKALADEYRKIGNQYIWLFDIGVARENQPLESPRIMDALDSLLKRNEISDPNQLVPFLKELSNDERIPLISRNHATRLITQIEKQMAKMKSDKTDKTGN